MRPIRHLHPGPEVLPLLLGPIEASLSGGGGGTNRGRDGTGEGPGREDGCSCASDRPGVLGAAAFSMAGPALLPTVRPAVRRIPPREETAADLQRSPHAARGWQPV